jgi:pyrroloquinoline quinone (PQQ) biosynthesis protein C
MPRHTDREIAQAANRFERLADSLDVDAAHVEPIDDLQAIAAAVDAVRANDERLQEAVLRARAHGRSWNHIALALGVSRQAARQRFAEKTKA